MDIFAINYLAVLVAAVAGFLLGMIWFSRLLFGEAWMRLAKIDPNAPVSMTKPLVISAIANLVSAGTLAWVLSLAGAVPWYCALFASLLVGFGIHTVSVLSDTQFSDKEKPAAQQAIELSHRLASFGLMGLIISLLS